MIDAATREGASVVDKWYIGSNASHVVCEGTSISRYLGHCNNLVTVSVLSLHLNVWINYACFWEKKYPRCLDFLDIPVN